MSNRVLGDLHQNRITGLQSELDALGLAFQTGGVPIDFSRIQNCVAATSDVDERRFHAGENILDAAQVHVADHRGCAATGDVVLDEHTVFEHGDLRALTVLSNGHHAIDRLATRQEFGLGQDRSAATTGFAAFAPTLLLGFESRGALEASDLIAPARFAHAHDRVGRIIR